MTTEPNTVETTVDIAALTTQLEAIVCDTFGVSVNDIYTKDETLRDIKDEFLGDPTKVRKFLYMSPILKNNNTNAAKATDRIQLVLHSGLAWFIVEKPGEDAYIDGWRVVYSPEHDYKDDEKETIKKRVLALKEMLKELEIDTFEDTMEKYSSVLRRDHYGAVYADLGNTLTTDAGMVDKIDTSDITFDNRYFDKNGNFLKNKQIKDTSGRARVKRIQVFPEHRVIIDNADLNEMGDPKKCTLEVMMASGSKRFRVNERVFKKQIRLFRGTRVDDKPSYFGASLLERNLAYIIMLEWCAFSGADYVANQGSFIHVQATGDMKDDKLKKFKTIIDYLMSRNRLVTTEKRVAKVENIGASGAAIPIGAIMDKFYDLLSTGTGIPVSKLKGAQKGAVEASKEDRIDYYPVLKRLQRNNKPILRWILDLMDPGFLKEHYLDCEWEIKLNMSDAEKEGLMTTRISNLDAWVTALHGLKYTVGKIYDKVAEQYDDLLPVIDADDPIREERFNLMFMTETPKDGDKDKDKSDEPPDAAEPAEAADIIKYHLRGLMNAQVEDMDAFCAKARISMDTLNKVIGGCKA